MKHDAGGYNSTIFNFMKWKEPRLIKFEILLKTFFSNTYIDIDKNFEIDVTKVQYPVEPLTISVYIGLNASLQDSIEISQFRNWRLVIPLL